MNLLYNRKYLKDRRRGLRRDATYTEKVLWQDLRGRKMRGLKFYRQFSVGNFILDFYCPEIRLAIELDGDSHESPRVMENDRRKHLYLHNNGISLLRFTDDEFLAAEGRDILARIEAMIDARKTPPAPSFQEGGSDRVCDIFVGKRG